MIRTSSRRTTRTWFPHTTVRWPRTWGSIRPTWTPSTSRLDDVINPSTHSGILELNAGSYRVQGVSVAGVYTSLRVPELGVVLDAGVPLRSFAGTDRIFLSHAHPDHAS